MAEQLHLATCQIRLREPVATRLNLGAEKPEQVVGPRVIPVGSHGDTCKSLAKSRLVPGMVDGRAATAESGPGLNCSAPLRRKDCANGRAMAGSERRGLSAGSFECIDRPLQAVERRAQFGESLLHFGQCRS